MSGTTIQPELGGDKSPGKFEDFYRLDFPRLVAFLMYQGAALPEAQDAATEAMVGAYRNWQTISQPRAWVRVVAARNLQKRRLRDLRESSHLIEEDEAATRSDDATAEERVQWNEALRLIRALPDGQRKVMALMFDGFTPSEIAGILHQSPETVRSHLRHARKALRARLTHEASTLADATTPNDE
jgi:RNA polymerase sigma factor (sigma-70 family)